MKALTILALGAYCLSAQALTITAAGTFTNGTTGESGTGVAQVASLDQCASLINAYRYPIQGDDGDLWYLTSAQCLVTED